MIRKIASAAILGALIACVSVYSHREAASRSTIARWLKAAPSTPSLATEAWPICTAMIEMGTEADWAELDSDFATGKKALVAQDWSSAIDALKLAALRDPRNADIQN